MYLCWSEPGGMERAGWDGGTRGSSLPARWARGVPAISGPAQHWWQSCGAPEQRDFLRIQFGSQFFELKSTSDLEPRRSLPWPLTRGSRRRKTSLSKLSPLHQNWCGWRAEGAECPLTTWNYYDWQILVVGRGFLNFPAPTNINLWWYFEHYPDMIPFVGAEHQLWISLCNVPARGFCEHIHLIQITWIPENYNRKNEKYPVILCDQGFNIAPMNWFSVDCSSSLKK